MKRSDMKAYILGLSLFLAACGPTVNAVKLDEGHWLVQRISTSHFPFAANITTVQVDHCAHVKERQSYGFMREQVFSECRIVRPAETFVSPGALNALGSSAITAGGMVGAGALIGSGLKHSGSTTTMNGNASGGTIQGGSQNVTVNAPGSH
jgi:hypothetical protein